MTTRLLEQVLADWRERASTARYLRDDRTAETVEKLCGEVQEAAHEYLTWMTERDAVLRSDRSITWLRSRFVEWEREGHARRDGRRRLYRMLIVPRRANVEDARRAGHEAGRAA